jgi:hypothetical protein
LREASTESVVAVVVSWVTVVGSDVMAVAPAEVSLVGAAEAVVAPRGARRAAAARATRRRGALMDDPLSL